MNTTKQNIIGRIVAIFLVVGMAFTSIPAPAYAIIYAPGATLNPSCLPTDVNCSVSTPNAGGTLSAPSNVSVTPQGTTGSTVYSYRVSTVDSSNGETVPSTATTTTAGNAILSATNYNAVSWSAVSGAAHYKIYGRTSGSELFIASTTATSYLDTGSTTPSGAAPTANTTGALSGNTLFITTDGTFGGALTVTGNTTLSNALTLSALTGGILQTNAFGVVSTTSLSALTTNALAWNGNTLTSIVNGVATTTLISDASVSLAGLVSTSTQTFGGNKTFTGTLGLATTTISKLTIGNLSGLLLASAGAVSNFATTTATAGQVLGIQSGALAWITPTTAATTTINGTNGPVFTFNAGAGLAISTSTSTLTFTPSYAGATTDGIVSTSTQTFAGNKTLTGATTLATTTVSNLLTANAGLALASSTPLATGNTLYNNGGTLYWNGSQLKDTTAFSNGGNAFGALATLGTTDNNALRFVASSTEAMRILANGNIGIGTSTPSTKLAVAGGFAVSTQIQTGTQTNPNLVSTGGTILGTAVGGTDTVIQYNSSGSFTPPTGVASVETLVVAGGGGGGVSIGGGGGAGGYRYVASQTVVAGTSYPITVGAGGAGAPNWSTKGSNGTGSSFTTITTVGGGAGTGQSVSGGGVLGGSGGGGARNNNAGGAGTSGEGNSGGSGSDAGGAYGGGGGGGAGAVGGNGSGTAGGNGGVGLSSSITGVATFYAGGGGGGRNTGTLGLGGNGGGGNAADTAAGVNGTANTGGGGGANSSGAAAGGAGGSGVVIVRFATVNQPIYSESPALSVSSTGTTTISGALVLGSTSGLLVSNAGAVSNFATTTATVGQVLGIQSGLLAWVTPTTAATTTINGASGPAFTFNAGAGLAISTSTNSLTFTPNYAGTTTDGIVSTSTQTFAGAKTFSGAINASSTLAVTGNSTLYGTLAVNGTATSSIAGALNSGNIHLTPASAVIGLNTGGNRLRLTAGFADTADNDQGANVDLHSVASGGGLDLVAGRNGAITFWTSPIGQGAAQRASLDQNGLLTLNGGLTVGAGTMTLTGLTGLVSAGTNGVLSGITTSTLGIALSDTTGILAINRGGTGTSTAPSYGQLLLGNSAGGYDLVATSTLGISGGSSLTGTTGQTLYFSGTNTPTATSTLFLSSTGNVGVGTINPANKFTVAGTLGVVSETTTSANPNLISTGGTILGTAIGGTDTVIQYNGSGSFTPPTGVTSVRYLVVAGGGGGGFSLGGGGGAGGFRTATGFAVTPGTPITVTVGAGGTGAVSSGVRGSVGGDSVFSSITSAGGGGGTGQSVGGGGVAGGSGGGGARNNNVGGAATPAGQGFAGGSGTDSGLSYGAGGGGGAGAVGGNASSTSSGSGGAGLSSDITGTATFYAGGGGGTSNNGTEGTGGTGGGGAGTSGVTAISGTANTGGGGGGAGNGAPAFPAGSGGSGIIIVRFATVAATTTANTRFAVDGSGNTTIGGNLSIGNLSGLLLANAGVVSNFATTTATAGQVLGIQSGALAWVNQSGGGSATTTINGASGPVFTFNAGAGLAISTSTNALIFTPTVANATTDGIVSTTTQTFAGDKTFSGATTLATTTASQLTISGLSGILTADNNGLLTGNASILIASTTGVLAVNRGGTGTTTAPSAGQLLLGNASGGYDLVATSSLGISGGSSQWTTTGLNIYYSTGNVAIGTSTPSASARLYIEGVAGGATQNPGLVSTGGTILGTNIGGTDTVIQYNSSGSFTPPTGVASVETLVVAGGGGGGVSIGGGGGAGGYRYVASQTVVAGTSYPITVGAGGAGAPNWSTKGSNGTGSSFTTITTVGGGAGTGQSVSGGGVLGGSGGGGARNNNAGGAGTSGEGNAGGSGSNAADAYGGGGGGGAGAVGGNGSGTVGGDGGAGSSSSITGIATFYAGGGGGGVNVGTLGVGGNGGGGNASLTAAGVNGTANTGGGGGANSNGAAAGGAGGSGIVIVRFATVAATTLANQALLRVTNTGTDASSTIAFFETGSAQSCIIAGQTGLSCSSDKNLKKDIEATEGVLGNVLTLKPVTYNWRTAEELGADGFDPYATAEGVTGDNVGFIAQDVEKIFPGLVRIDPNGNRTLAYDKFAPLIVAALQEQYGGMMGINIASVGDVAELFSSASTLAILDDDGYGYDSVIRNPIGYISERVEQGIKVVRTLVTERIVAVEATFKRIFANELCLVDDETGNLVCVDAKTLRNINGAREVLIEDMLPPQTSEEIIPTEVVEPAPVADPEPVIETAPEEIIPIEDPIPFENAEEVTPTEVVETVPEPSTPDAPAEPEVGTPTPDVGADPVPAE